MDIVWKQKRLADIRNKCLRAFKISQKIPIHLILEYNKLCDETETPKSRTRRLVRKYNQVRTVSGAESLPKY